MTRRPFPARSRLQRGFSLIEAMIAMVVFVIGALGLLRLMYSSAEGTKAASKMTVATTLGRSRLDELVTLPYEDDLLTVGEHKDPTGAPKNIGPSGAPFTDTGAPTGEFNANDGWYARSWVVAENVDQTFKTITMTVRWWDPNFDLERQYEVVGGEEQPMTSCRKRLPLVRRAMPRQRGFTLMEMMVSIAVTLIVVSGAMFFLIQQARMSSRSSDRSDLQRSARAGLSVMEEKIRMAGLGLPRRLAIRSYTAETCGTVTTPRLVLASVEYVRQWTVQSTDGDNASGTITLSSANPEPTSLADIDIEADRWVFLFKSAVLDAGGNSGHGIVQVGAKRNAGATAVSIGDTDYSVAQPAFNLAASAALNAPGSRPIAMLLVDVAAFGVDCTNAEHPYLYWDNNGERVPVASNVDTRTLTAANAGLRAAAGDVVGLRFRFLMDSDGDGVADDQNGDSTITAADFVAAPTFNADSAVATHDDVMAIEILVRLRSEELDAMNEYRIQDFVRVVRMPNINTKSDQFVFIGNSGI